MLRISKLADYGTIVMVYLAKNTHMLCTARDIAEHTHLTVPTVSKLLKRLTTAGFLTSGRGVSGGYRLQQSSQDISVAQIIQALEGQHGLTQCSTHPNACSLRSVCGVQSNWRLISHAIEAALDSVTLEMLAKPTLEAGAIHHLKQLAHPQPLRSKHQHPSSARRIPSSPHPWGEGKNERSPVEKE